MSDKSPSIFSTGNGIFFIRIGTAIAGNLNNVAFKTPAGKTVLLVVNDGANGEVFNIKHNGKWATTSLDAGAVGTFIW